MTIYNSQKMTVSYAQQSISQSDVDAVIEVLNSKFLTQALWCQHLKTLFLLMWVQSMHLHLIVQLALFI